jgi:glycerophosphoryl diester phosphodiesterase
VSGGRPLRLAHRGDWRVAPENTLGAFEAAMRIPGCDGVEFDVRLARDGVPVLLHDETLNRVQHRRERVDRLTAEELAEAGIPRLDAVLAALPGAWLDVELKGADHGDATADALREARGDAPDDAVISSFDPPALVAMRDGLPGWGRWLNTEDLAPATLSLEVAGWTVRRTPTFERLGRLGVVACCVEAAALGPVPD